MKTVAPADLPVPQFMTLLQSVVAPRPIAFVSSQDQTGRVNLSPFSFFNLFSANPPVVVFSPSRRVRDNTNKHTLENVYEVPEVVVNLVDYALVEQTSLASTEYAKGVNEFVKAGLTPVASNLVAPPRVAEAPAALECKVTRIIPLGDEGGAGNLVVCQVLLAHFQAHLFGPDGRIDPHRADLVARLGSDWYCRAQGPALFEVAKPLARLGIGVDQLPANIRLSNVLTGNHLGKLANVEKLPNLADLLHLQVPAQLSHLTGHELAAKLLEAQQLDLAWKVLLENEEGQG
ncbi:MAG: flavin reductase family protein [Bernardetiaceae bacterium]|jgi:flavin reductase (DIM6/NTAB) family NADH-FMN oxidoreductase RutF|nr:flavin reductase family protein [Bernardetiaceae bacterium]